MGLPSYFHYTHFNPPKPFNHDYNPNAKQASANAVQRMEQDGVFDKYTREQRQEMQLYQKYYREELEKLN